MCAAALHMSTQMLLNAVAVNQLCAFGKYATLLSVVSVLEIPFLLLLHQPFLTHRCTETNFRLRRIINVQSHHLHYFEVLFEAIVKHIRVKHMVYGKSQLCSKTYYHVYIFSLMKKSQSKNGISRAVQGETRQFSRFVGGFRPHPPDGEIKIPRQTG